MKILFLQNKVYFDRLIDLSLYEDYELIFDGLKHYKIKSLKRINPDLIVSAIYTSPASNVIISSAKKLNIKTVFINDGIFDFANSFYNPKHAVQKYKLFTPMIYDYMYAVGDLEKHYLGSWGSQILNFNPKYMKLGNGKSMKRVEEIKYDFLLTTSNTPDFNYEEYQKVISFFKEIIQICKKLGYTYRTRIYGKRILTSLNISETINDIEEDFPSTLNRYQAVISTPSSLSINVISSNKPFCEIIYRDTPFFSKGGWVLTNTNQIESVLDSMVSKDQDRLNYQRSLFQQHYQSEADLTKILDESEKTKQVQTFELNELERMLNSKFNLNIEYFIRKIYSKTIKKWRKRK